MSIAKLATSPSGVIRETTPAATSVYQTLPSGADRDPERIEALARFGQSIDLAVAHPSERRRAVDGEPDGAVRRGGDGDRHVLRCRHAHTRRMRTRDQPLVAR